jgi:hypothetical protein
MFDKLYPKTKNKINNRRLSSLKLNRYKTQKLNYKQVFITDNNYMRDLIVQKNKNNIHCYDMNRARFRNNFSKSLTKLGEINDKLISLPNYTPYTKKMTFFNTGKYDIPLLTDINNN